MRSWARDNVWPIVTISGLLLLNVVLIAVLLSRPDAPLTAEPAAEPSSPSSSSEPSSPSPSNESSSPSPSASGTLSASESSSPSSEPSDSEPSEAAAPAERLLAISTGEQGWRATVGDCDKPGVIEITNDGGQTWETSSMEELSPVTRIKSVSRNTLFAIGGGTDCKARYDISYSSGAEWESRDNNLGASWYQTPRNRNEVKAAGGDRSKPCAEKLVDLAAVDENNAAALCADGTLVETNDAGRSWDQRGELPGGAALGADVNGWVVGSLTGECAGVALTRVPLQGEDVDGQNAPCAPLGDTRPGQIAVATDGNRVWAWAGSKVAVSDDGGRTW